MTSQQRRSLILALPVAMLVGIGLFGGGFYFATFQFELLIEGKNAAGTVTALEFGSSTSASGQAALFPIVTYKALDGRIITFRHRTGAKPAAYAVGERVVVTYLPNNPDQALIAEGYRNWLLPLVLLICGSMLTLLTGISLWRLMKGSSR
jgi:Protein of unknown function (DUF3592)